MKKMRGTLGVVIAAIMSVAVLAGCGEKAELTGYEGKYESVSGEMMGITLTGEDISGWAIDLQEGGKGTMEVDGESAGMKWTLEGNQITVSVEGEEMTGTIEGNQLVFDDILGMGMKITFEKQ